MKRLIILSIFIITSFINISQTIIPLKDSIICYGGVVDCSKSQIKLYEDSKEYFLLNYTNKNMPVVLDEKNERIYAKGVFEVPFKKYGGTDEYNLIYTFKAYFKENKYRYEVTCTVSNCCRRLLKSLVSSMAGTQIPFLGSSQKQTLKTRKS